jgi:hypothetical protein
MLHGTSLVVDATRQTTVTPAATATANRSTKAGWDHRPDRSLRLLACFLACLVTLPSNLDAFVYLGGTAGIALVQRC